MNTKNICSNTRNWTWKLTDTMNSILSDREIKNIINKKLAYIIVELEHNPISYINVDKLMERHCEIPKSTV